jgi:hypothetical protein
MSSRWGQRAKGVGASVFATALFTLSNCVGVNEAGPSPGPRSSSPSVSIQDELQASKEQVLEKIRLLKAEQRGLRRLQSKMRSRLESTGRRGRNSLQKSLDLINLELRSLADAISREQLRADKIDG